MDLDATLLEPDQTIHPRNHAALEKCVNAGLEVMLATGRVWDTTAPIMRQLAFPVPAICTAGAQVYDKTGALLQRLTLPLDRSREILRWMRTAGISACANVADNRYLTATPRREPRAFTYTVVSDLADSLTVAPDQITVWGEEAVTRVVNQFACLQGEIQLLVLPSHEEPLIVHILHPRATKGWALDFYCRRQGICREEVIAFGDSLNDFTMLSFAGVGVAMPYCEPGLRIVADRVLEPEETIAQVLEEQVLAGGGDRLLA